MLREPVTVAVVGAGIAGVSAALVLAERGARVTLLEREARLGGRLSAWPRLLADGSTQLVDHGFHGFFRQYYTWRSILRRIDPELSFLRPLGAYPVVSERWPAEDFARLPAVPPFNLLALVLRSPNLHLADLRGMDGEAALPLLAYDRGTTYRRFDRVSAADLLDSLRLAPRARSMLFDVFAHSFFNREEDFSAAEMMMMFHFYFLGNREGLAMDAPAADYQTSIWGPLGARLDALGVDIRLGAAVDRIDPAGAGWRVSGGGVGVTVGHVVIAADVGACRRIVAASTGLTRLAPSLGARVAELRTAAPYAVARFWLDRDCTPGRARFSGVAGQPTLDSATVYHRLEQGSARWARRTGGGVIELHAYACDAAPDAATAAEWMWVELGRLWPEAATMRRIDLDARVRCDAPAFPVGGDRHRPGVVTDASGVYLAGDWVRLPFPSALMERAAAAGVLAANAVLDSAGAAAEPVRCVVPYGLLARRSRR